MSTIPPSQSAITTPAQSLPPREPTPDLLGQRIMSVAMPSISLSVSAGLIYIGYKTITTYEAGSAESKVGQFALLTGIVTFLTTLYFQGES